MGTVGLKLAMMYESICSAERQKLDSTLPVKSRRKFSQIFSCTWKHFEQLQNNIYITLGLGCNNERSNKTYSDKHQNQSTNPVKKLLKFLIRILAKFLSRPPRIPTILQDLAKSFKRKANKSEWKQTKTNANSGLISVPIQPRLFALPCCEFYYFLLSHFQYFKE